MSRTLLVTGAASGVGLAFCHQWLARHPNSEIVAWDVELIPSSLAMHQKVYSRSIDLNQPLEITDTAKSTLDDGFIPDTIVQCAGVNFISPLEKLETSTWHDTMSINAAAHWRVVQAFLPGLIHLSEQKCTPLVMNVISNASHMPMTDSAAYNASKGAAHILTLQMARELTRKYGIAVFGISPNKLSGTKMSDDIDRQVCESRGWSLEEARKYQLQSLLWREETPVEALAEFMVSTLANPGTAKWLSGCIIPFGG